MNMNDIDAVEDFTELWSLPSSSELESEHSNFELEHDQEYEIDEFRPLLSPCTTDRVVMSDSLALPQEEEEGGAAQTIQEHSTSELADPESTFDWNSEETSSANSSQCLMLNYGYMEDIDEFVSVEEEGEIGKELDPPTSSLRPESPQSSYRTSDLSLTHHQLPVTRSGFQELERTLILLEPESLVESELEFRNTQSTLRILLTQMYPYCLRRAPSSSFKPDYGLYAVTEPQCLLVHPAHTLNLKIIHAPLQRSIMDFDEGVEYCILDGIYFHVEEADHIPQVSPWNLLDVSVQCAQERNLEYHTRIIKRMPIQGISFESSSGFNLDVDDMPQVPVLALMNEAFDESWMIAMLATPHSSYEISGHSLMHYSSAMTHFWVRESEQLSVRLDSESQVKSGLELSDFQSILRVLLAQLYPLSIRRALSPSFKPDHALYAATKPQRLLIHSAHALNLKVIHASWKRSFLNFDGEVERDTLEDAYAHAGEVGPSVSQSSLKDFRDISIRRALKRNLESQVRIVKWKFVPASSCESSTRGCILRMRRIENSSRSMIFDSGSDSDIEKVWQAPELGLLEFLLMLQVLLAQLYPLSFMRAPSSSLESNRPLQAVTKLQCFLVHSAHATNSEIVHASLRRSLIEIDDGVDYCVIYDVYAYTEEANLPISQISSEEFHGISTQHARKWDFGYLTGIVKSKLVPASSHEFSATISVPQTIQIENPSRSMVLNSGFDLNDETILQAPEIAPRNESFDDLWRLMDAPDLDEGIGCSIHTGDQSTMRHSEVQESERSLVMSKSESAVESELELLSIPCISQISLVQSNHPNPTSALSAFFALDRLYLAVNKSQCMPVHSARMLNLMTIRTSLRKSHLEFSDGAERCAMYDAYGYAEEANPSILPVSSKELSDISVQRVPKRDFRCLMRIFKLKHALASSYGFSATTSVPWTSTIESSSHSMVLGSGFDLDIENMSQVQELALLHEGSN